MKRPVFFPVDICEWIALLVAVALNPEIAHFFPEVAIEEVGNTSRSQHVKVKLASDS
jgi:hypothetical protein